VEKGWLLGPQRRWDHRKVRRPAPTLRTTRLRLRPFADPDANDLFALHGNGVVMRSWDGPVWSERTRSERFIAPSREMAAEGIGARLAVDRWCGEQGRQGQARARGARARQRTAPVLGELPGKGPL